MIEEKDFLIDEINNFNEFINDEDIALFLIQAHAGPFYKMHIKPKRKEIKLQLKNDFLEYKKYNKQKEIYQQISENVLRIHIVPFLKKYKSLNLLCDMIIKNFDYFDEKYLNPINIENSLKELNNMGILDNEKIIMMLNKYNSYGEIPEHSIDYKKNIFPCYQLILNDVIKEYIKLL